jgi:hypothetical protein
MPSAKELAGAKSQLAAGLAAGVKTLSGNQSVTFTKYVQLILPFDGYVFWVRSDLISNSALLAACQPVGDSNIPQTATVKAMGSFHYASDSKQLEDESPTINRVIFTALEPIQDFNQIAPNVIFIGEFEGVRFAFNQRKSYYKQTDLHHYTGEAIYPAMESQIIDDSSGFDSQNIIVSNSLPVWLSLCKLMPVYPSFLVSENLQPPYASAHVYPDQTKALQAVPSFNSTGSHYQLVSDKVKITVYGLNNADALDYQDYVYRYMSDDGNLFGLMNMPVIKDEKRTQSELKIIAMKKSIEFEVSYYQTRVNDVARQFIKTVIPTYQVVPAPF